MISRSLTKFEDSCLLQRLTSCRYQAAYFRAWTAEDPCHLRLRRGLPASRFLYRQKPSSCVRAQVDKEHFRKDQGTERVLVCRRQEVQGNSRRRHFALHCMGPLLNQ